MSDFYPSYDYEPVAGPRHRAARGEEPPAEAEGALKDIAERSNPDGSPVATEPERGIAVGSARIAGIILRRGHAVTYAALFLFTIILYLRPAELWPSPFTASIAYVVGVMTLIIFLVTQVGLEGNLTARPREVNLVLLLCLLGILTTPFAIDPALAWETFSGAFIRCVLIFIVMVNAVRTTGRLRGLLWVALLAGIVLSVKAVGDYRSGNLTVEGYRVGGTGEGIFGNPNDLSLFLATMVPVAVALGLGARSVAVKLFYAAAALMMAGAIMVTFSRGGFLGMAAALLVMAWKVGRRNRLGVALLVLTGGVLLLALAPGNYGLRLLSIFVPGLDPVGSSGARQEILYRSIWTTLVNPLLGVGMGNFPLVSFRNLVSHNSYTQVSAEMGLPALVVYVLFLLRPLKGLFRIERAEFDARRESRYYYLAAGLQASLIGYIVSSFFASVAYLWYVYYVVGYAVCLRRIYESDEAGRAEAGAPSRDSGSPDGAV